MRGFFACPRLRALTVVRSLQRTTSPLARTAPVRPLTPLARSPRSSPASSASSRSLPSFTARLVPQVGISSACTVQSPAVLRANANFLLTPTLLPAAPPPPKTMTKEWQEASNERAIDQKMNPIYGTLQRDRCVDGY